MSFSHQTDNKYLTPEQKDEKLRAYRTVNKRLSLQILTLNREVIRSVNKLDLFDRMGADRDRGDLSAFVTHFTRAITDGRFNSHLLKKMTADVRNQYVKPRGRRFDRRSRLTFEWLCIKAGPAIASTVAVNLFGPSVSVIKGYKTKHKVHITGGVNEATFKRIAAFYKDFREQRSLPKVPVMLAEDETAVVRKILWRHKTDTLEGFCGVD
jgi:hypothetical protein